MHERQRRCHYSTSELTVRIVNGILAGLTTLTVIALFVAAMVIVSMAGESLEWWNAPWIPDSGVYEIGACS